MRWRLEAVFWFKKKACWSSAGAIALKSTCHRGLVPARRVEVSPLYFGRQDNLGGLLGCWFRSGAIGCDLQAIAGGGYEEYKCEY